MLEFICSYFNFSNSSLIKHNYIKFRKNFPYKITTIEIALPNQKFFIEDSIKIVASKDNIFWQKERCLNLAIANSLDRTKYIAWIDTDIKFYNNNLKNNTLQALEEYPVVQLFEKCVEYPKINSYNNNIGIGYKFVNGIDDIEYPHIGYCWAFHKDILVNNKLYDADPIGNSDVLQLMAWLGLWNHRTIVDLNPIYRKEFLLWAWDSYCKVQGNIGYVSGYIEHFYHGKTVDRRYNSRNNILTKHEFSIGKDLEINDQGLYKLKNKPLIRDIEQYFMNRAQKEAV